MVREYRLAYDNNGAVGRSRIASVQECGSDGVCLNSTTFFYQQPTSGWASTPQYTPPDIIEHRAFPGDHNGLQFLDVNGDGLVDIIKNYWVGDGRKPRGIFIVK